MSHERTGGNPTKLTEAQKCRAMLVWRLRNAWNAWDGKDKDNALLTQNLKGGYITRDEYDAALSWEGSHGWWSWFGVFEKPPQFEALWWLIAREIKSCDFVGRRKRVILDEAHACGIITESEHRMALPMVTAMAKPEWWYEDQELALDELEAEGVEIVTPEQSQSRFRSDLPAITAMASEEQGVEVSP